MTRTCWRTMASLLALALGGIVVWAEDHSEKQAGAPQPPCPSCQRDVATADPACAALLTPVVPLPPTEPVEETKALPMLDRVALPDEPPPPPSIPVPPPPMPATATPVNPPVAPKVEMPAITLAPAAEPPPVPMSEPTPAVAPPPPPVAPALMTIAPSASVVAPSLSPFPWKLHLEMVAGLTHFELRHNDAVQMRVQCEKLDLQSPQGGLQASGRVAVSGPCLEASCDRLLVSWQSGQIALEGHVRVICQNNGVRTELGTESICFRLSGAGSPIEFSARDVSQQIMPARR